MSLNIFFAADPADWPDYGPALKKALADAGIDAVLSNVAPDPKTVDYIVFSPGGTIDDFTPYTNTKAVLNLWAGVEKIVGNTTLTQPLTRMVDPAMTETMVEYVVGHVLRHHLGMDEHILHQDGIWRHGEIPPLARERPVAILGMGELGQAVAKGLLALNFPVRGWSRTPRAVPGVATDHAPEGLTRVLTGAQVVILLMPNTPDTASVLNAERLALLAKGAFIINPGRGPLIDDAALLAALDSGQVGHATLDVFRVEPLPAGHAFWRHPRVTVTPHIAAQTRPDTASAVVVENIRRAETGEPLLHLVDRQRGY